MEQDPRDYYRGLSDEQLEHWLDGAGPKHAYYHIAQREYERRQKEKDEEKANPPPTPEILRQQDECRDILKATDEPEQLREIERSEFFETVLPLLEGAEAGA